MSGLQHKILSHEVTPPPGVWDKIAAELDESELDHVFPSKLYEAEVLAPPGAWDKIAAELDGSELYHVFPSKLYEAEVAAPPAAWKNIAAALDAENELVAPKRRVIAPWMRYAAAAVIIGLVAWGGLGLLNNKKEDTRIASGETTQPLDDNSGMTTAIVQPPATNREPEINTDRTDEARNDAALEASKKTYAKLELPSNPNKLKNIASAYSFASNTEMLDPAENYVAERDPADLANRYIVLMTADGHFVRMAKKLSNMVCCVSGEEQDKECVDQMSRWKEKMACSPTGHSTGSFLDILSLIKSLEEK